MDVVGENEALQQFFEGKSLVLRGSCNNFQWQWKYSNCLGLIEGEKRKKKSSEGLSSFYTKLSGKAVPEWNSANCTDALQCLFLCTLTRRPKGRWTQQTPQHHCGNCQEEKTGSGWGLLEIYHFWNLSEFHEVRALPPCSIMSGYRGFSIPNIIISKMVIGVLYLDPSEKFNLDYFFWSFGWDLSCVFPKDMLHSSRFHQSAFLLPHNLLSNRFCNKMALLRPCCNMIQNGCSKAYAFFLMFAKSFFSVFQFILFFFF